MKYTTLPAVGSLTLPTLDHRWTPAFSPRKHVADVEDVWLHRWGGGNYQSVINEFMDPANQASSHFVYAGETGPFHGQCIQMVHLDDKSWTEAAFNSEGISIECADPIWLGKDPVGFARLARIVGWLLHHELFPAAWVRDPHTHAKGFTRHADGGADAGGHTSCPTTDLELWSQFIARVKGEFAYGKYRKDWAV